jgi:hypothetical protein
MPPAVSAPSKAAQAKVGGFCWPVLVTLAFGSVMVGAGVLLFVSAHWDEPYAYDETRGRLLASEPAARS